MLVHVIRRYVKRQNVQAGVSGQMQALVVNNLRYTAQSKALSIADVGQICINIRCQTVTTTYSMSALPKVHGA